ncbi:unnamed protein product [Bursaphelenchus xylophilus]|uniref:(pine wood nematode) hypothetical protein n=1 Tax=Bursaphelenchus xylophilus TaxID=6326 RepID=A0A1I7RX08_BURXY|nr:unnamed protein product [Bursaphelenchus xylophilus]CAG9121249.1 unnamed protein product [Bursaphelenchus xylophilus]
MPKFNLISRQNPQNSQISRNSPTTTSTISAITPNVGDYYDPGTPDLAHNLTRVLFRPVEAVGAGDGPGAGPDPASSMNQQLGILTVALVLGQMLQRARAGRVSTQVGEEYRFQPRRTGFGVADPRLGDMDYGGPVQNKFQCYSCMSMSYQNNWDRLQHLYVQPKVFTDRCENPSAFDKMPTIECGSVCVSLVEANVEGGVFMGFKYIRGCINRILTHDFNLSALRTHRLTQVDVCRNMPRAVLFNNPKTAPQVFGEVNVCTCYGDRCNSGESAAALLSPSWRLAILATLIIQLISRISL